MKKRDLWIRVLAVVLAMALIMPALPEFTVKTEAATTITGNGVEEKLSFLKTKLLGKHFTIDGSPCVNSGEQNDNFNLQKMGNQLIAWGLETSETVGSATSKKRWSCCAFAEYTFHYLFGLFRDSANVDANTNNYEPVIGDLIQWNYNNGTNHYGIFIKKCDNGRWKILDSNWGHKHNSTDKTWVNDCFVQEHDVTPTASYEYTDKYGNKHYVYATSKVIYHAKNYDDINTQKVEGHLQVVPSTSSNSTFILNAGIQAVTAGIMNALSELQIKEYGFYLSTDKSAVENHTAPSYSTAKQKEIDVRKYAGELEPGTTYYCCTWAKLWVGKTIYSDVQSYTTTEDKPDVPTIVVSTKNVAIKDAINVSWNASANAKNYQVRLYDSNGTRLKSETVQGTTYSFAGVNTSGTYYAAVEAYNSAGSKGESSRQSITVHPNVIVRFLDWDDTPLTEDQTIGYGKSASAPADPSRVGYTFSGWDGAFANVTMNTVIRATYAINYYNVRFVDENGQDIQAPQKVAYGSAASAPSLTPQTGYALIGWDQDFSSVKQDLVVKAQVDWYNQNFSVFTTIDSAVRVVDAGSAINEGYEVEVTITNNANTNTRGRVVVALLNQEGRLVTTTESAAFTVKRNDQKAVTIFTPCDSYATTAEVFVVSQYSSVIPIAAVASAQIDQNQTWTDWSTEEPAGIAPENIQSRTEYRSRSKVTTTSYDSSLSGWTQISSEWVEGETNTIDYVSSWPAGFEKSHDLYTQYNNAPVTAYTTATTKREVTTSTLGYIYWHWCRGDHAGANANRLIEYHYSNTSSARLTTFHAFYSTAYHAYQTKEKAISFPNASVCDSTKWWCSIAEGNSEVLTVKQCTYTDYQKQFTYEKWSDWTEWSTAEKTANATTEVETRTVYRYRSTETPGESQSGNTETVSYNAGVEYAGRQATLFIYKVDSASDYTNEYVGQTVIDVEGKAVFTFKLREEPTIATGDFTAVIGIEGASAGRYLSVEDYPFLKAPKPQFSVRFFDIHGNQLGTTQSVTEGDDAVLPAESLLEEEGYRFLNWKESNRNIRENLDIYPNYELKEFAVVFVDWTSHSVSIAKYRYGETLTFPTLGEAEENQIVRWDTPEGTVVQEDLIVTTVIEEKEVTARILSCNPMEFESFEEAVVSDNQTVLDAVLLDTKNVPYDTAVNLPELEDTADYIFLGWKVKRNTEDDVERLTDTVIKDDVVIYPEYAFAKTVEEPVANVETGEYDAAQTLELSCATENAVIWYTTDGTDPATSNTAVEYVSPVVLSDSCRVRFIAMALGMNNSVEESLLLAINTGHTAYHILNVYCGIGFPETQYTSLVQDGFSPNPNDFVDLIDGYIFGGFYIDPEYEDQFIIGTETVTSSMDLYAKYTAKTYTVTFRDEDGTVVKTETVSYGEDATPPEVSKTGFVFIGWDSSDYLFVSDDVTVTAQYVAESEYATVRINRSKLSLMEGSVFTLKATVKPAALAGKPVRWSSDNYSVVTVDQNGQITAVGAGTATVKVTVIETGESAECVVTVSGDPTKAIYLNRNSYLDVDGSGYLRRLATGSNTVAEIAQQFQNERLEFYDINGTLLAEDGLVGTGTRVVLLDENGTVIDEMTCIMTGDYSGDGKINNRDVVMLNQYVLDKRTASAIQMIAVDVNGDGYINNRDCSMLARYLVGKESLQ